jgi:hypothetical protein
MQPASPSRTLASLRERLLWAMGLQASLLPGCTSTPTKHATTDPASADTGTLPATSVATDANTSELGEDAGVASACANGRVQRECFSREQLVQQAAFGVGKRADPGPIRSEQEVEALFQANGCMPPEVVHDGCCNAALGPAEAGNEGCCYAFCTGVCCGRPFWVGGEARVAAVVERRDWLLPSADPSDAHTLLPKSVRARLADAWRRDAQLEHASVAAFARFTLELLEHGAPAALVLASQRAGVDEVEHARMCFGLASRYAGRALGPDALALDALALAPSLRESALLAVLEGCIGEALAAAAAQARLDDARCPEVRRTLARIVEDETAHAELSFRYLAWALAQPSTAGLGEQVEALLEREQARTVRPAREPAWSDSSRLLLRAHGWLDPSDERTLRALTFAQVIAPCIRAALAQRVPTQALAQADEARGFAVPVPG